VLARFAVAVALASTTVPFLETPALAEGRTLRGTWVVQVRLLTSCAGGSELPPFWSLLTFASGGTVSGTTMNQAFAPGQRSPDHGTWARTRGRDYTASSLAFINFTTPPSPPVSPGFQNGAQRIDQAITLADDDMFTSDAKVTFFDATGQAYRQGCAVATGYRYE
jgi:hypothetical protein